MGKHLTIGSVGAWLFSVDGMNLAVGAPGLNIPGYVKVYHSKGEDSSWKQLGVTLYGQAGEAAGDNNLGEALSFSSGGKTLAIGWYGLYL